MLNCEKGLLASVLELLSILTELLLRSLQQGVAIGQLGQSRPHVWGGGHAWQTKNGSPTATSGTSHFSAYLHSEMLWPVQWAELCCRRASNWSKISGPNSGISWHYQWCINFITSPSFYFLGPYYLPLWVGVMRSLWVISTSWGPAEQHSKSGPTALKAGPVWSSWEGGKKDHWGEKKEDKKGHRLKC